MQVNEGYFEEHTTLTPGSSEWEYTIFTLPTMPELMEILHVTDTDGRPIEPIVVQRRAYSAIGVSFARNLQLGYWIGGNYIYINSESYSESIRLYYTKRPALLLKGTASAGADTTLTFASSPPPDVRDDYYNLSWLILKSGTGAGERAQITDFAGGTRVATVDFTTTPDATSVYATESELPPGHNEIVAYGAAIRCLQGDVAQFNKLDRFITWYRKLELDLMDYIENRQKQKARGVYMRNDD